MFDESLTSANLKNDHGFIIKEHYLSFLRSPNKATRVYAQSGQYHTIVLVVFI